MNDQNDFQRPGENGAGENGYTGNESQSRPDSVPENGTAGAGWQSYPPQDQQGSGAHVPPAQGTDNQAAAGGAGSTDPNAAGGGFTGPNPAGPVPPQNNSQQQYNFRMEDYDQISANGAATKQKSNTGLKIFAVIISVLLVVTLVALGGLLIYSSQNRGTSGDITASGPDSLPDGSSVPAVDITLHDRPTPEDQNYTDGVLSTEEIYSKVRPSVVGIVTYEASNPLQAASSGSGIILSSDGYIITNAHVVSSAYGIVVVLDNDEEYEAKLIGIDEQTDLAVIKVEASNLTAAEFGNSDELVVGERIVAIGNPTGLNLAGSTTQGIVSGLNRNITLTNDDNSTISMEVIQVDAAINPGNSGGALINKYGQVVGINSSKLASTTIEGIGFAIPINNAKPIADDLIQYGYVRGRVRLGITYYPISDVLGAMYGYTPGLLVYSVDESLDVSAKGIKAGDTITQIDGQDVRDSDTVKTILEGKNPGDSIELTVFRKSVTGKTSTFKVKVELAEDKGSLNTNVTVPENEQNQQGQQNYPFQLPN